MRTLLALLLLLAAVLIGAAWLSGGTDHLLDGDRPPGLDDDEVARSAGEVASSVAVVTSQAGEPGREAQQPHPAVSTLRPLPKPEGVSAAGAKAARNRRLLVRVLSSRGEPVPGVPLELRAENLDYYDNMRLLRAESGESDGCASFDLSDRRVLRVIGDFANSNGRFHVDALLPFAEPVSVEVLSHENQGEPVDLVLPGAGNVEVHVTRADGTPLNQKGYLSGTWISGEEAERRPGVQGETLGDGLEVGPDGVVLFGRIGLGLRLSFIGKSRGLLKGSLVNVAGPSQDGETVKVELRLGQPLPLLRGRIINLAGEPLASERVGLHFFRISETGRADLQAAVSTSRLTDGGGHFQLPMDFGEGYNAQVIYRRQGVQAQKDAQWSTGTFQVPAGIPSGAPLDVGAVRLQAVPTLAHGHVVDATGEPVQGALLKFEQVWGDRPDQSRAFGSGPIYSAPDGSFRLRATRTLPRLGVRVTCAGYAPLRNSELPADGSPVVLRLERGQPESGMPTGSLAIRVREDTRNLTRGVGLSSRGPDGVLRSVRSGAGLGFQDQIRGLRVGTHDLQVTAFAGTWVICEVKGVEIRANQVTRDARLLPLDLSRWVRSVSLQLVLPTGRPVRHPKIEVFEPKKGIRCQIEGDRDGLCRFPLPVGARGIEIALDGGTPIRLALAAAGEDTQTVEITRFSTRGTK